MEPPEPKVFRKVGNALVLGGVARVPSSLPPRRHRVRDGVGDLLV